MDKPWTSQEIVHLKRYRALGYSAAECGALMGRSRNAVIGKLNRLRGYRPPSRKWTFRELRQAAFDRLSALLESPEANHG